MKIITKAVLDMETMKWVSIESYDYEGPVALCCGPSGAEKSLSADASSFSKLLSADFSQRFSQQDAVLGRLNASLSPIISAGPSQQGMSAQELAALNTTAINTAGAANRNARQAVANFGAGRGSDSGLESGIQKQLEAGVASNSANQLANAQLGITKANYDQGNANYWKAQGFSDTLAQAYNPSAYSGQSINANEGAFNEAKTITDQTNAEQAAIAGGISSLAMDAIPGGAIFNAFKGLGGPKSGGFGNTTDTN